MAIDTSIYGQIRQPEPIDMLGNATKAVTLSHLAMQTKKMQDDQDEQDAIKAAFARNVGADGSINRAGALSDLAKVAPIQAMQYKSQFAEQDAKQAEAKQKVMADHINQLGMIGQFAMSAKDQQSYDAAVQQAASMGIDTSQMPKQFDPSLVKRLAFMALDGKQRLENMVKGQEMDINAAKAPVDLAHTKSQTDKNYAEIGKIDADKKLLGFKGATDLREEWSKLPITKATSGVSVAYNKIQSAANDPSPAGDLSLIFGYMKALDPDSSVREGEQASAQNAGSAFAKVGSLYNQVLNGTRLTASQRADFLKQAGGLYQAQLAQQNKVNDRFRLLALQRGVNPDDVILNIEANQPNQRQQTLSSNQITPDMARAELERRRAERESKMSVARGGAR